MYVGGGGVADIPPVVLPSSYSVLIKNKFNIIVLFSVCINIFPPSHNFFGLDIVVLDKSRHYFF